MGACHSRLAISVSWESKGSIYPILSGTVTQTKYRNRKELEESAVTEGWD